MRVWHGLLLALVVGACVDLSRPPGLERPVPGTVDGSQEEAAPDAGTDLLSRDVAAPAMVDAGVGPDLTEPADVLSPDVSAAVDAAPPIDQALSPDLVAPPPPPPPP